MTRLGGSVSLWVLSDIRHVAVAAWNSSWGTEVNGVGSSRKEVRVFPSKASLLGTTTDGHCIMNNRTAAYTSSTGDSQLPVIKIIPSGISTQLTLEGDNGKILAN